MLSLERGDPDPVDPLHGEVHGQNISEEVKRLSRQRSSRRQNHLGLPLYGRQWPTASSDTRAATGDGIAFVMGESISCDADDRTRFRYYTPYVLESNQ